MSDHWLDEFASESTLPVVERLAVSAEMTDTADPADDTWMDEFEAERAVFAARSQAARDRAAAPDEVKPDRWLREFETGKALVESKRESAMRRVRTPAVESPAGDAAAVEAPAVEAPAAGTPVVKTRLVETRVVETPVVAAHEPIAITLTVVAPAIADTPLTPSARPVETPRVSSEPATVVSRVDTPAPEPAIIITTPSRWTDRPGPESILSQAAQGDYECPKCRFLTLRRGALRCAACHADVPEDYWAPILAREREQEEARKQQIAREEEERVRLAKKMADDWARLKPARERRARLAAQLAERRRQVERWNAEAGLAEVRDRTRWRRIFTSVYFLYVLPGLVLLSAAIVSHPAPAGPAFWAATLVPVYNWLMCVYLVAAALPVTVPAVLPDGWNITAAFAFTAPYYPVIVAALWVLAGITVSAAYPAVAQARVSGGAVPVAPVRPGGAVLALGIGALMLAIAIASADGTSLVPLLAQTVEALTGIVRQ